jgi:mannose-6-phosphate isomerase
MTPAVIPLDNPVLDYAWGSKTAIATFLGRPPSGGPEAELWIGAHPKAPSRAAEDGTSLLERIRRAPEAMLGATAARFGELPFLLKVIAAAEPLSIQCHPNLEQARLGFERETRAGIPLSAPERNYRDANHKPELVVALAPFVALQGFRPVDEILSHLRSIPTPEIERPLAALRHTKDSEALEALFSSLLSLDRDSRLSLVARVAETAAARREADSAWRWVAALCAGHPGDVGVLAPLLLNLVELQPGDALYLPAGELHAYLEGTAVEIMANSDNVLRGGLTTKHVDVRELLGVASFRMGRPQVLRPERRAPGESVYRTPAREFELAFLDVTPQRPWTSPRGRGVELLLGLEGDVVLVADGRLSLARGRAAFVPAAVAGYRLEGSGRVCRAAVPD